jgi:uncharacterized membrane protein
LRTSPWIAGLTSALTAGATTAIASKGQSLVPWPDSVRTAFPAVIGSISGATTAAVAVAPRMRARHVTYVTAGLAVAGTAGYFFARKQLASIAREGAKLDPALIEAPVHPQLSGSPDSLVDYPEIGREGARFVHSVTTAGDSLAVGIDRTMDPIRAYVSVANAQSIAARVDLALKELIRTEAFDREYLLIQAPAGSGYANSTPIDVLEILSGGNCASVAISYGFLPSFLSLTKVELAGQTQRALLDAIAEQRLARERAGKSFPQLLVYGESLGAKIQQYAVPLGSVDLDRYGIDRALWVGTPGGKVSDAFHLLCSDNSITIDRPELIPDGADFRVWFLEHDGDPVVRFRSEIAWSKPHWLTTVPRGRNIPESMTWLPGVTWATVLVDTIFATDVKPGDFQSLGHDYRADLGVVATRAFGFNPTPDQAHLLEVQLRHTEVARAQRIEPPA